MDTKKLSEKYLMKTYNRFDLAFEKGEDVYLFDESGAKYLDFASGIAVNSLGYSNPEFENAVCQQIKTLCHTSNLYHIKQQARLARMLVELSGLDKAFFCNSGAEANEAALKLARKFGGSKKNGASKIIAMKNSFHGRTMGALSLTGQDKYQKAFVPLVEGIDYAEFNNLESVEKLIDENTCGIFLECIQGEGGVIQASQEFYDGVRKICDTHNILMIIDEVQTGIARCGKMFCFEHFNSKPDIICLAKALGNGIPIGAMVANEKAAQNFEPGDHASTFGGNFIAATAAICVLNQIEKNGLIKNAQQTGQYLKSKLLELPVKQVRGLGLMLGAQINASAAEVVKKCHEKNLLLVGAGANTVRFLPPLTVTKEHVDSAVEIFGAVLAELGVS